MKGIRNENFILKHKQLASDCGLGVIWGANQCFQRLAFSQDLVFFIKFWDLRFFITKKPRFGRDSPIFMELNVIIYTENLLFILKR